MGEFVMHTGRFVIETVTFVQKGQVPTEIAPGTRVRYDLNIVLDNPDSLRDGKMYRGPIRLQGTGLVAGFGTENNEGVIVKVLPDEKLDYQSPSIEVGYLWLRDFEIAEILPRKENDVSASL